MNRALPQYRFGTCHVDGKQFAQHAPNLFPSLPECRLHEVLKRPFFLNGHEGLGSRREAENGRVDLGLGVEGTRRHTPCYVHIGQRLHIGREGAVGTVAGRRRDAIRHFALHQKDHAGGTGRAEGLEDDRCRDVVRDVADEREGSVHQRA